MTNDKIEREIKYLKHRVRQLLSRAAGDVSSVFGRTGAVVAASNDYTWAQVDKTTSSIGDITTRSAGDLSSGDLAAARMQTNIDSAIRNAVAGTGSQVLRRNSGNTALEFATISGGSTVTVSTAGRELSTNQTTTSTTYTTIDTTNFRVNVTTGANRVIIWAGGGATLNSNTQGDIFTGIATGGTVRTGCLHRQVDTSDIVPSFAMHSRVEASGTRDYDIQHRVNSGTATIVTDADTGIRIVVMEVA